MLPMVRGVIHLSLSCVMGSYSHRLCRRIPVHNLVYVPICFGMVDEIVSSEAQVHDMTCFPTAKDPKVLS